MVTQVMSVNNGSDPLGGGNVYVNNSLQAGSSLRAPIFYDTADTGYYGDFASTSVMNSIRFGTSTNNGTLSGAGDWGMRFTTDAGYITFGPANGSYAHIYTDRGTFYFNKDLLVNGNTVWHAGNDGSGSGLDADLLDGQDQSYYFSKANMDASRNIGASTNLDTDLENGGSYGSYGAGGTSWNSPFPYGGVIAFALTSGIKAQFGFDIRHTQSDYGDLWYRTKNNVGYSTWRTMWHSGNLTNLSQLTNGPGYLTGITSGQVTGALGYTPYNSSNPNGYITGISFANVSSKPTTISGYGITDAITTANIGSQSVSYAATAGSAPNGSNINSSYDVAVGNGNGLRFWGGSDSYKISMGVGALYQYGPVTDYSIKTQMNDSSTDRGFTWGRISYAPIAALNANSGDMQIAGSLRAAGHLFTSYNGSNILLRSADNAGDAGILVQNSGGSFKLQLYGNGSDYGFLNGNWAGWDIRKTIGGVMYMNNNNSYYIQTNSTSNFYALNIQGSAVVHAGNIGSQSVSNSNYINSTRDTPSGALQYWNAPSLGLDEAPSSDWHNTIRMGHGSPLSYYSNTLAVRMTGSGVGDIYTQTIMGGTAQGWKKHWNDGNDGSGSGLDADLLDGQQGSYYQPASSAITTSNIGSQSVSYATTAGALTSMNISQFTNNSGYITGYTETDTLNSVTGRGNTTSNSVRFGTHVDLSPTASAFRFYDGTTFRGGFGLDSWGHSGSDANLVLYVNGDNTLFFSTSGTKRASLSSTAFNSLVALQQSGNQVLHAGNYTSYSPSLTGSGASGTWNINVTGNAGSATTATNLIGLGSIQSTSTGTSYTANYQVRENSGGGGNTNEIYAPQLAFHWSGVVASSIMMESSGRMAIRNNPGGSYENFIANVIYANSSFQGNLTGNVTGNVSGSAGSVAWTNVSSRPTALSQFTNDLGNYGGFLTSITAHTHAISDVTGLQTALDSKQASLGFTPYNSTNPSGYITSSGSISGNAATATNVAWTGVTSRPTALSQFSNDLGNYGGWLTTSGKAADSELIDGIDSSRIIYGDGSLGSTNYSDMNNTAQKSGFFFYNQPTGNPFGDWTHWINCMGNSWNPNYGFQLAHAFHGDSFAVRRVTNGSFASWRTIIDSGNIGSQSVSYASTAGTATNAGQLNTYGYLVGDNWDTYYTSGKLRVASASGATGVGRPPSSVHNYGSLLSYGISGEDMFQMYFPDNAGNSIANSRKLHYRTGRGTWCDWRTVVDMVGDTLTIVEGGTPKIVVRGSVPYGQATSASIELVGDADGGQTQSYRWISNAPDWNGQELRLERKVNNSFQLVGRVPKNTNNLEWQGTIVQGLSDSRVKTNVVSMTEGLDKIDQIRPVTFDWVPTENVSDREGADFGFIAQELEEVLPEVVHTRGDGYKTVMYEKVVPVLVQAMKEQQAMIEALKAEIELLKNK
jgi:hypothetical protein